MKILSILLTLLVLTPLFIQIYQIIKDEQDRKARMRFYDLHSEFLKECDKIQDNNVKLKAFEWLLEKLQERRKKKKQAEIEHRILVAMRLEAELFHLIESESPKEEIDEVQYLYTNYRAI